MQRIGAFLIALCAYYMLCGLQMENFQDTVGAKMQHQKHIGNSRTTVEK